MKHRILLENDMREYLIIFLILFSFCACDSKEEDKTRGEPRTITHPETGLEYYYEVPGGKIYVSEMTEFCEKLDFEGTGWRWPNIDELRELVTGCPNIMPGGKCGITNDNYDRKYYSGTDCGCYEEDSTANDEGEFENLSIIHDSDSEKACASVYSSTPDMYTSNPDSMNYWKINFVGGGSLSISNYYAVDTRTDPVCVRDPQ
jgi:hypothetical protein